MNFKMVGKFLGYLLLAEAFFMLPAALVALIYREPHALRGLLFAAAITAAAGAFLFLLCRHANSSIYVRESFVVAGGGWVLISIFGAFPFVLSGDIPNFINALFESTSGFTTTGSSILMRVEDMSHALLFWRSFTHWLGGIGILAFILVIVRAQGGAAGSLHLLRAESTGPQVGKTMPKTKESVQFIFTIYIGLSAINLVFLLIGGMPLFDALCIMFGTAGTGGFGILGDSMGSYSSFLQTVTTIFMILFGVNFSLYYLLLKKEWRALLKNEELRLYIGILIGAILLISASLTLNGFGTFKNSLHHGAFTVSSIMTTAGFATVDFSLWPQFTHAIILVLMIFGCMAGSTGGGFKLARILILAKSVKAGLHRLIHPRSVTSIRMNGKPLDTQVSGGVYMFLCVYCGIAIISFVFISIDNMPLEANLSAVLTCLNNVGPGLGLIGPAANFNSFSGFSKLILTLNMLLGRLEIFPILFLFFPSTWRRKA